MNFPTLEEIKRTEELSRDEAIEVYEDALAFNETLSEFARSDDERRSLATTMAELRRSLDHLALELREARFLVPHRTLVIAFGHPPKRVEAAAGANRA